MRALPGGSLSLHRPIFPPRAGRTRVTRDPDEESLKRGNGFSLGPLCARTSALPSGPSGLDLTFLQWD